MTRTSVWAANPLPYGSFIRYSMPVFTGAFSDPGDTDDSRGFLDAYSRPFQAMREIARSAE
ncbi:MAG: hypothetical protein MI702_07405, partial [Chlorobiales bacterium]|nr:hypothetical protein [Chlorobiales bacterium]